MTMEGIGLFAGIKAKLDYTNKSQALVSQNIANADTPHYQPQKLKDVDFGRVLKASMDETRSKNLYPDVTKAGHLTGFGKIDDPRSGDQRITYEIAPAGNAVVLEEQMIMANENMMDSSLMNRVLLKNVSMIKKAIGTGK